jgi:hypothetical protein
VEVWFPPTTETVRAIPDNLGISNLPYYLGKFCLVLKLSPPAKKQDSMKNEGPGKYELSKVLDDIF